jgi:glucose/mannose-6-phosphate isomerase
MQPRAALGFSFLPLICFMQKLGFLLGDKSADVAEMVGVLKGISARMDESSPLKDNPGKKLAKSLYGYLPVIYGAGMLAAVAHRWKTQINENSKAWSFYEVFPELNHNAVVGYRFPGEMAGKIKVVLLRSSLLSQRIRLRHQVTCELLDRANVAYELADGEGSSPLSQLMSLVLLGDYVSCYLAVLYGSDPSPVDAIDYIKQRLAKE